jgi:hypothetical protein
MNEPSPDNTVTVPTAFRGWGLLDFQELERYRDLFCWCIVIMQSRGG